MKDSRRLGRVFGVEVRAHWSVLVIAWLLTWSQADVVLPEAAPGYAPAEYLFAALCSTTLFLCALLAHELAHAIVARRSGVAVGGIDLWIFGGVSSLESDTPDPGTEFRVAIVGPMTSVAVAAILGVGAAATAAVGDLAQATLAWLVWINLLLAFFNLVPAFPLDGGRVLRAVLWARRQDRESATRTAASIGQVFGYLLIALGILLTTSGGLINGLWFVVLGWFLLGAATAEHQRVVIENRLGGASVVDLMSPDPEVVSAEETVESLLWNRVIGGRYSAYPVVDRDGNAVGIVTLGNIRNVPAEQRETMTVGSMMTPLEDVAVTTRTELLTTLLPRLVRVKGERALVLDDRRVVGIVTARDVQRVLAQSDLLPSHRVQAGPERAPRGRRRQTPTP